MKIQDTVSRDESRLVGGVPGWRELVEGQRGLPVQVGYSGDGHPDGRGSKSRGEMDEFQRDLHCRQEKCFRVVIHPAPQYEKGADNDQK